MNNWRHAKCTVLCFYAIVSFFFFFGIAFLFLILSTGHLSPYPPWLFNICSFSFTRNPFSWLLGVSGCLNVDFIFTVKISFLQKFFSEIKNCFTPKEKTMVRKSPCTIWSPPQMAASVPLQPGKLLAQCLLAAGTELRAQLPSGPSRVILYLSPRAIIRFAGDSLTF